MICETAIETGDDVADWIGEVGLVDWLLKLVCPWGVRERDLELVVDAVEERSPWDVDDMRTVMD